MTHHKIMISALALMLATCSATVSAKLAPLTPEQVVAKADKKAKADAQVEIDKQDLLASMDSANTHWRKKAAANGLRTYPATAVIAPVPAAPAAPALVSASGSKITAAAAVAGKSH